MSKIKTVILTAPGMPDVELAVDPVQPDPNKKVDDGSLPYLQETPFDPEPLKQYMDQNPEVASLFNTLFGSDSE